MRLRPAEVAVGQAQSAAGTVATEALLDRPPAVVGAVDRWAVRAAQPVRAAQAAPSCSSLRASRTLAHPAGNAHSGAIECDTTVTCWGSNSNGQLGGPVASGPGVTGTPTSVWDGVIGALAGVEEVALGTDFSCARTTSDVYCWGRNNSGQLGISGADQTLATALSPALPAKALALGRAHACAITGADDRVRCWGSNVGSQLGRGASSLSETPGDVLIDVGGTLLTGVSAIAAGGDHTCAWIAGSNTVACWGRNQDNESGGCCANQYGYATPIPAPTSGSVAGIVLLSVGPSYSCVLAGSAQDLWCWGDNAANQWGGVHASGGTPVNLLDGVAAVTLGGSFTSPAAVHACGIRSNRGHCWGAPNDGRLGNGTSSGSPTDGPVPITLTSRVVQIEAGSDHACAVVEDGRVACWGKNNTWQVTGRAATAVTQPVPVIVNNL
jgi:alpha-tubulin suppressor-like RCC1 family protein